jgi:hypothetical protein
VIGQFMARMNPQCQPAAHGVGNKADPEFEWEPIRSEKRIQLKIDLSGLLSFKQIYDFGDQLEHMLIKVDRKLLGDPSALNLTTTTSKPKSQGSFGKTLAKQVNIVRNYGNEAGT